MELSLADRLKQLKYYGGTCNEGTETFNNMCTLAYQLTRIGQDEMAEKVVTMVEELCKESEEYIEEGNEHSSEYVEGFWGYSD